MERNELITHLESVANTALPESFCDYSDEELALIAKYADDIVAFQTAGLDKLFASMSLAMKYIPKFALISLTKSFLEPSLAAKITQHLEIKQTVTVGNGLPADYLAEVTTYQEPILSGKILARLQRPQALATLQLLCQRNPLKALDLHELLPVELQKFVANEIDVSRIDPLSLRSAARKATYSKLMTRK